MISVGETEKKTNISFLGFNENLEIIYLSPSIYKERELHVGMLKTLWPALAAHNKPASDPRCISHIANARMVNTSGPWSI